MLGRKSARLAAAGVAMALALTACGGDDGNGSGGGNGSSDSITLGVGLPPTPLAAANASWANESVYLQAVYDTLLRQSGGVEIEPWLATEWSYNEDKTVLTMQLRDDVTFTDGEKFTADVAAQNVLRFKNGTSANASLLAQVADATATDEYTLQITLSAPDPALLQSLSQNAGLQASPASFDAPDAQTNPVGSGPYVLTDSVVGSSYTFEKNPDYWAPDEQHYETITMSVFTDQQAALNALQGNQLDVMPLLNSDNVSQIEGAGYTVESAIGNGWTGLMLLDRDGQLAPELGDVRVRQAIAHAIDREALLQGAANGEGEVTGQIVNPANPGYDEALDEAYPYDPEEAEKLLAEAGYPDGFTLRMPLIQLGAGKVAFDLVRQYLGDVGITVDYVEVPIANIATELLGAKFPATIFILGNNASMWQDAIGALAPNAPLNVFKTQDPKVDELLTVLQTGSEEESDAAAKELNEFIVDEAWFVPFFRGKGFMAVSSDTEITLQDNNSYPYLWNIRPKG